MRSALGGGVLSSLVVLGNGELVWSFFRLFFQLLLVGGGFFFFNFHSCFSISVWVSTFLVFLLLFYFFFPYEAATSD